MEIVNQVRAYHYLSGVLAHQAHDVYCPMCSAWNNTLNNTREAVKQFETGHAAEVSAIAPEVKVLLIESKERLAGLVNAENPQGQKKAGNCKLPQGVCFVKLSRALLENIQPPA